MPTEDFIIRVYPCVYESWETPYAATPGCAHRFDVLQYSGKRDTNKDPMKSVRLDETLEVRLREAARMAGVPPSTFIRQAVEERCDRVLAERLDLRLADVIGTIHSQGGRASRTGKAFLGTIQERHR